MPVGPAIFRNLEAEKSLSHQGISLSYVLYVSEASIRSPIAKARIPAAHAARCCSIQICTENLPSCSSRKTLHHPQGDLSPPGTNRRSRKLPIACWSPACHKLLVPGWIYYTLSYRASKYAMSTPSAIARSAPIAIASKKPTNDFNNLSARDRLSASMSSTTSAESGTNTRSRKDRPCDACRRRKSRCVIHEGQTSCVLCQFHTQDCTFVQSPQPRKRKLNTEGKEESSSKRRYVQSGPFS